MKQTIDLHRITIFLAFAFGIAWAFGLWVYLSGGIVGSPELLPGTGITLAIALIAVGYMWAPALAHILTRLITREGWKDMGLRLHGGKNWWTLLAAWFLPAILTFLGAIVYFLVFPEQFDPALTSLHQMVALVETQSGQTIPFSVWTLLLIQMGVGILIAPLINSLFTFGEEFGWRAYLQPKLLALGYRRGLILMGVIWGVWHWPVIAMGHNYGFGYWGAPWTGFLAMTWFTLTLGIVLGWLTIRGQSVWPAVIGHAAINGIAAAGVVFLRPDAQVNTLFGPAPVGIIAGIPVTLLAAYLLWKGAPPENAQSADASAQRRTA